jgi:predicted SAM-dependent methyltransferase
VVPSDNNLKTNRTVAKRLDIGCGKLDDPKIRRYQRYLGHYEPQQYIGVDRVKLLGVDIVADITQGLPFEDETVEEIICIHVLEHIRDLEFVMKEFHRILKAGGVLRVWVPHCFSPGAFGDSTHVRFFTYETLLNFDASHPSSYYYNFHFKCVKNRMQLLRRWYKPNLVERLLEKAVNWRQRQGERFLKILPYKDWEVYFELMKTGG